jgi:hypothetical protein
MAANDDDCVKRIIKSYLHFKGEASTDMIVRHILDVDYGLRKTYTPSSLGAKMKYWSRDSKSGGWFRVVSTRNKKKTWWRLE